jgi:type IV fimbrial biogenesis protein FimT
VRPSKPFKRWHAAAGLTLVELMVVVTITAILAAIALPDFTSVTRVTRIKAEANALANAVSYAKSEAIRRNTIVVLCQLKSGVNLATPACATTGTNWALGWAVFADDNDDHDITAGEALLTIKAPQPASMTIELAGTPSPSRYLTFNPAGESQLNNARTFVFQADGKTQMYLIVNAVGRTRLLTDAECLADSVCLK